MPAHRPEIAYSHIVWRLTLMPASRAASRLPPIATVRRPNVVRLRSTQPSAATIAKIQMRMSTPMRSAFMNSMNPRSFDLERAPFARISARPRAATSIARVAMNATTLP